MKTSVYIATSLDGFIARPDGALDWLLGAPGNSGDDYGYKDFIATVDVIIMGRATYEKVLTFGAWPYEGKHVVVLSSRALAIAPERKADVEVLSGEPADVLKRLSERGFTHAYVDGGQTVQRFLSAGLIEKLIVTRIPVLIGRGIPLFGPVPGDIPLRHSRTHAFPNGFVQTAYEAVGA
jgi:dihydrofolate reductase